MYGTTMKKYSSSKSYQKDRTSPYQNKSTRVVRTCSESAPKTRYMKINKTKMEQPKEAAPVEIVKGGFSRKEFPIASVIFTAIATMVVLLLTTGVLG